jgi:hypothetical protein
MTVSKSWSKIFPCIPLWFSLSWAALDFYGFRCRGLLWISMVFVVAGCLEMLTWSSEMLTWSPEILT